MSRLSKLVDSALQATPSRPAAARSTGVSGVAQHFNLSQALDGAKTELADLKGRFEGATPVRKIPTDLIDPSPVQDRAERSLADDDPVFAAFVEDVRKSEGNLVPALARPTADGRFQLVYGHRRWRACAALNLPLRVEVVELSDEQLLRAMLKENRFRLDLSVYENLLSVRRARSIPGFHHFFQRQAWLAEAFGVSQSYISKLLAWEPLLADVEGVFKAPLALTRNSWSALKAARDVVSDAVWKRRLVESKASDWNDGKRLGYLIKGEKQAALPEALLEVRLGAGVARFVIRTDLTNAESQDLSALINAWLERRRTS